MFENIINELNIAETQIIRERDELRREIEELTSRNQELLQELDTIRSSQGLPEAPTSCLTSTWTNIRFLSRSNNLSGMRNVMAQLQSNGVNAKRLRLTNSNYRPSEDTLIVNWGGGFEIPENIQNFQGRWLNSLDCVKVAANKLKTFQKLYDSPLRANIPEFTQTATEATWDVVYCRETLHGHSGEGIVVAIVASRDELPAVPLYVQGLNIRHEYRVHVVGNRTKIQRKARAGNEVSSMTIRNNANGWTFVNNFSLGERGRGELATLAKQCLEVLGLDFGAVDIIRTEGGEWKILEVNTAPGVESPTNIEWYADALTHI